MTDYVATGYRMSAETLLVLAYPVPTTTTDIATELSGIVVNQNADIISSADFITLDDTWVYQTFHFPPELPRGREEHVIPRKIPPMTGFQVDSTITTDLLGSASIDWRIDYSKIQFNPRERRPSWEAWQGLVSGTEIGTHADGEHVWFNVHFDALDITSFWDARFRLGIRGRNVVGAGFTEVSSYTQTQVTIGNEVIQIIPTVSPAPLIEGRVYPFSLNGVPALLYKQPGSGSILYALQDGLEKIWYSAPNPLSLTGDRLYGQDGVNPITDEQGDVSLRFRILCAAPSGGTDCFGNEYQHVVVSNPPSNLESSVDDLKNAFWLSKPNPSKFAVESLYFDMRETSGSAVVVDHVLMDPVTPGVYFHVYYSNDPAPGEDVDTWDNLLWTRVDQTFLLRRRESYTFPEPIKAKYIKIEFTHLQPRHYSPGTFQEPMVYRKHPKWVLDFFMAQYQTMRAKQLEYASAIRVSYDALDIAYNYYLDDLRLEEPKAPLAIEGASGVSLIRDFLKKEQDKTAGLVDPTTLFQISTFLKPYTRNPFAMGRYGDILKDYASPNTSLLTNYSTEIVTTQIANTTQVSSLNRETLAIEKGFPVMSFWLPSRHQYKLTQASFEEDRGYFVGLKEVSFTREHYASRYDHDLYIETAGDNINVERNDFANFDNAWAVYEPNTPNA